MENLEHSAYLVNLHLQLTLPTQYSECADLFSPLPTLAN